MGPCVAYCLCSRVGSVAVAVPAPTICFAPLSIVTPTVRYWLREITSRIQLQTHSNVDGERAEALEDQGRKPQTPTPDPAVPEAPPRYQFSPFHIAMYGSLFIALSALSLYTSRETIAAACYRMGGRPQPTLNLPQKVVAVQALF